MMSRPLVAVAVALSLGLSAPRIAQGADPRRTPVVQAVERASPAVVTLQVELASQSPFAGMFGPRTEQSEGSGVIIREDGVVLTNAHVVDGAVSLAVTLSDGARYPGEVLAADRSIDLALVRVDSGGSALPTIPLGDSDDLLLGEPAIAIGNPYGLGLTVSTGVVASEGRDVRGANGSVQTYIQTDAAINPGNSGGALVNIRGELIGVNTFIHSAAEGIGFAIPVNRAKKIADDLLLYGTVQVPWLGVYLDTVRIGRPAEGRTAALVRRVDPAGPAEQAGVRAGELILGIDGHDTGSRSEVNLRLAERAPGDAVTLRMRKQDRAGVVELRVRTGRAPDDLGRSALRDVLGIRVDGASRGVVVAGSRPDGSFARAGLRVGDVIVTVNGRRIARPSDLVEVLYEARAAHLPHATFVVARGRIAQPFTLDI